MNIEDLESQISYYATKYYMGEPEITDEQFDALVDRLRELKPDSSALKTGWGFEVIDDKVRHKYNHIGSLDKCKSFSDIPEIFKNKMVYVSPKLDGLSAVVYYNRGILVKGVTRGNGEVGKDITDKLIKILGTKISDMHFTGAVRGELIISNSNWEVLNTKYKDLISPRNFSAGIINRKDIDDDLQYIDLVVYKVIGQEGGKLFNNRGDVLHWLSLNFDKCIPDCYYPVLNEPSWLTYHEQTFEAFKQLGYGLDGLVLTSPDVQYNYATNGYVYTEVAYKFQAESTVTTIKNINWTLSRTQRLVPVANVEPVELSGAIVENATCNNAKQVKDWGLGVGSEIKIQRSNEIIPYIMETLNDVDVVLPEVCPICNEKLVWDGVDLKCPNKECPNIDASNLQVWCETIGETDGLQYTIMKQYLDKYNIHNLDDLYKNIDSIILELSGRKLSITEGKILEFFTKLSGKYSLPADKVLTALNIPRLGDKTAKLLQYEAKLIYDLYGFSISGVDVNKIYEFDLYKDLLDVVKEATTNSIIENISKIRNLRYLWNRNATPMIFLERPKDVIQVAVTGALNTMKRKDFEKYINNYGYVLSSNIKSCKYLITNDSNSGSAKNKQAQQYGVTVITEGEFLNMLNK